MTEFKSLALAASTSSFPWVLCSPRHARNSLESRSPWPDSSFLKTSMTGDFSLRLILQIPSQVIVCLSPASYQPELHELRWYTHTIQKGGSEINTKITIPSPVPHPLNLVWNLLRLQLLQLLQYTVPIPKAHNDLGHTEQEGLDPEFEEFALVSDFVSVVVFDLGRGFQFDPIDRIIF